MKSESVVVDSTALLDLMVATDVGLLLESRLEGCKLHAPSHIDAEVVDGICRLERAGLVTSSRAIALLESLTAAPIVRHPLPELCKGAWPWRERMSVSDALYVALAQKCCLTLITTDSAKAGTTAQVAELIAREPAS
jgi:predicted nucleic acid-binding protein